MEERKEAIVHMLLNLVRGLYKAIDDDWRKSAAQNGLTVSQQHLLWILHFENGSTLSEISAYGLWHLSTVMDLVDRMESRGLVSKEIDHNDARTKRVYLTEKGKNLVTATYTGADSFKFLDVVYNEDNKHLLAQNIEMLYNLNKVFHGDKFVNFVANTTDQFPIK